MEVHNHGVREEHDLLKYLTQDVEEPATAPDLETHQNNGEIKAPNHINNSGGPNLPHRRGHARQDIVRNDENRRGALCRGQEPGEP